MYSSSEEESDDEDLFGEKKSLKQAVEDELDDESEDDESEDDEPQVLLRFLLIGETGGG